MAIERYVVIAADPSSDSSQQHATFFSSDLQESRDVPIRQSSTSTCLGWGSYLRGVIAGLVSVGVDVPPIEAVIGSNIPRGGGLSSVAALEVAAATMLEGITCHQLEPWKKHFFVNVQSMILLVCPAELWISFRVCLVCRIS